MLFNGINKNFKNYILELIQNNIYEKNKSIIDEINNATDINQIKNIIKDEKNLEFYKKLFFLDSKNNEEINRLYNSISKMY